jgi:hypothetical protein
LALSNSLLSIYSFIENLLTGHADLFTVDAGNTNQMRTMMDAAPRQNIKTALSRKAIIA